MYVVLGERRYFFFGFFFYRNKGLIRMSRSSLMGGSLFIGFL